MTNTIRYKLTDALADRRRSTPSTLIAAVLVLGIAAVNSAPVAQAAELKLDARALYEQSVSDNIKLSADGAIVLQQGVLIEDDGPAAGYSYQPNQETLSKDVWIKKDLIIPDPRAKQAYLLIGMKGKSSSAQFTINGKEHTLKAEAGKPLAGSYWDVYALEPGVLQPGKNEIVLSGPRTIGIARDDEFAKGSRTRTQHPNRSAKSTDGGKTWNYDRLGKSGDIDGEYYVRVFLEQHQPQGSLLLPVVDAGNLAGKTIAAPVAELGPVQLAVTTETGRFGKVTVKTRTGSTYVPDEKHWSAWREMNGKAANLADPAGRYLQIAVDLTTSDPQQTPKLQQISVSASPKTGQWTEKLKVLESHNEKIVRTSIPFEYEPFDHPTLKAFRQRYKLDDVVKGAKSEFELITRLAAWSSQQWGGKGHLSKIYPNYNALEILQLHADGTPVGGFCQQYNIVFLQACESFGLVGRSISMDTSRMKPDLPRMSGHEVTEIWSNEYQKWVYVDGDSALYIQDAETKIPLSLLEFRERKIAAAIDQPFQPVNFIKLAETKYDWKTMDGMPPAYELRLIPRSNYLQEASPLPLNQGMQGWFWTGHYVWTDEKLPASFLYGNRISKRQNFEWTLNQAHYVLEPTETPGEMRVHLDTQTPGFETFVADIDNTGKKPVASGFLWKLHPGKNRLEVRPRNIAGREGIASWIVIEYSGS